MTYFTALTQTRQENHERKWVKGGEIQGTVLNLDDHMVRVPGVRSPPAASPNYAVQGEDA